MHENKLDSLILIVAGGVTILLALLLIIAGFWLFGGEKTRDAIREDWAGGK